MRSVISPWMTIWVESRSTVRRIIHLDPAYHFVRIVYFTGALCGFLFFLSHCDRHDVSVYEGIFFSLLYGPLVMFLLLFVQGVVIRWTGGWFGGDAPMSEIRTALAWPLTIGIWTLAIAIFAKLFDAAGVISLGNIFAGDLVSIGVLALITVLSIKMLSVQILAISEVQGFGAWMSFLNIALGWVVMLLPFAICAALYYFISIVINMDGY